jgi:predicted PurR-regulated permease PerM
VLLVYVGIAVGLFVLLALVVPPVITQVSGYLQNDDRLATRLISALNWVQRTIFSLTGTEVTFAEPEVVREAIAVIVRDVNRTLPNMVGGLSAIIGNAILVVVIGLYWLGSYQKTIEFATSLFRVRDRQNVESIILRIESMMGSYVRGLVMVAFIVGVLNFIILTVFRVPNAVTLAFIIGFTTILPIIGGFLGGGIAFILALLVSPVYGLITIVSFVAVQQVETHFLTPRTMSRSIGVDPILVILGVFFGFTLYGVVGAILSIPLMGTIFLLIKYFIIEPRVASVQSYTMEGNAVLLEGDAITSATGGDILTSASANTPPSGGIILPS